MAESSSSPYHRFQSVDQLSSHLKDLIIGAQSNFQLQENESLESAENAMVHLDEIDPNFNKYEIVKSLRTQLYEVVGPLIESELERFLGARPDITGDREALIRRIEANIRSRPEYSRLSRSLQQSISQAMQQLLPELAHSLSRSEHHAKSEGQGGRAKADNALSSSTGSSMIFPSASEVGSATVRSETGEGAEPDGQLSSLSLYSALHPGSLIFMTQESLLRAIEQLDKIQSLPVRQNAMLSICRSNLLDVEITDNWQQLKKGLLSSLLDQDDTLSNLALHFVAKVFSSPTPNSRNVYALLAEYLCLQFQTRRSAQLPALADGLDLQRPELVRLLKAFRLMNEFQMHICRTWIRMPVHCMEEMVECTLAMLASAASNPPNAEERVTPLHCLALVDPRALWFLVWTHSHFSRSAMIPMLGKHKTILVESVRSLLAYLEGAPQRSSRTSPSKRREQQHPQPAAAVDAQQQQQLVYIYTSGQLQHLHALHSLVLFSKLIFYRNGRALFPLALSRSGGSEGKLEISRVITELFCRLAANPAVCAELLCHEELFAILMMPLERLSAQQVSPQDTTPRTGTRPAKREQRTATSAATSELTESTSTPSAERHLIALSEVLCAVASNSVGRHFFLSGERAEESRDQQSESAPVPAQVLARFVQRGLTDASAPPLPRTVLAAFVYVVRQLYSQCAGLLALRRYELHEAISAALERSHAAGELVGSAQLERNLWEEQLRDNLLQFAPTPHGIYLLYRTGALTDCLRSLYPRFLAKKQMSKCEKFGYGMILAQLSCSSAGIVALERAGFVSTMVSEAWYALEGSADMDLPPGVPGRGSPSRSLPTCMPRIIPHEEEKFAHKPLINLVKLLYSFEALYELVGEERLPTQQEYDHRRNRVDSVPQFLDRAVLLAGSSAKLASLFNGEFTQLFGLRLLDALVADIDAQLLLQAQYRFIDVLLADQTGARLDAADEDGERERGPIVVDELSVQRNYILVKCALLGGPSERLVPSSTLEADGSFAHPLFDRLPLPAHYFEAHSADWNRAALARLVPTVPGTGARLCQLIDDSFSSVRDENSALAFLERLRVLFLSELSASASTAAARSSNELTDARSPTRSSQSPRPLHLAFTASAQVFECAVRARSFVRAENPFAERLASLADPSPADVDRSLRSQPPTQSDLRGARLVVDYGIRLGLLQADRDDDVEQLVDLLLALLRRLQLWFQPQQAANFKATFKFNSGDYKGFDWFAGFVFILMHGNADKVFTILRLLAAHFSSPFLWPRRFHNSVHFSRGALESSFSPFYLVHCHFVEHMLQTGEPHAYNAFKLAGHTPALQCAHWQRQLFLNSMDADAIAELLALCVLCGVDHLAYVCVALIRDLQRELFRRLQAADLVLFLRLEPIRSFQLSDHLDYIRDLESKYKDLILTDAFALCNGQI